MMTLQITKSARVWGYVIWNSKQNDDIKNLISGANRVHVYLNGSDLGEKNVDWRYLRISLGYKFTRRLPANLTKYILNYNNKTNELTVVCQ